MSLFVALDLASVVFAECGTYCAVDLIAAPQLHRWSVADAAVTFFLLDEGANEPRVCAADEVILLKDGAPG